MARLTIQLNEQDLSRLVESIVSETIASLGAPYWYVRHLAHELKAGDKDAIVQAAGLLQRFVPPYSILIPVPQHSGKAEYTLELANRLAKHSKSQVLDILYSGERKKLYNQKINNVDLKTVNLGFNVINNPEIAKALRTARNVILIDNVVDSGTTYNQAHDLIKQTFGVDSWMLCLGNVWKTRKEENGVIRSTFVED